MGMEQGERIFIESLSTEEEYKELAKKYPNTYTNGLKRPMFFNSEFKWRYRMGESMKPDEISIYNLKLKDLLKKVQDGQERLKEMLSK